MLELFKKLINELNSLTVKKLVEIALSFTSSYPPFLPCLQVIGIPASNNVSIAL